MIEDVKKRLESFGYTPVPADDWPLQFTLAKVEQDIRDNTNQPVVPEELRYTAVDMVVGEFLLMKKASPGGLEDFDLEAAEKAVSMGDTKVDWGDGTKTPEQRLDTFINYLLKGKGNFAAHRRIAW